LTPKTFWFDDCSRRYRLQLTEPPPVFFLLCLANRVL